MSLPPDFELSLHCGGEGDLPEIQRRAPTVSSRLEAVKGILALPLLVIPAAIAVVEVLLERPNTVKKRK